VVMGCLSAQAGGGMSGLDERPSGGPVSAR
jgi:hypothetical protein